MINRHPGVNRVGRLVLVFGCVIVSFSLTIATVLGADDAKKISWRDDLAQAQAEAKSRDLLLWIQFTGPWCVNCRRMDRSVFVHGPIILDSRERFVPVKLRSDEYENLTQSLGLTTLPATVIVRPNGEVVDKSEGYVEPETFEKFLNSVLTQEGRSADQVAARAKAKADKDLSVALAGYDPVTLLQDHKLVPGRPELSVEHDGRVFRFANETGREAFLRKPQAFAPVNGGRCPVSQVDRGDFLNGDPRWGVVYLGHLYLFKDVADRDRFAKDPERYAGVDHLGRSTCAHCREHQPIARRITSRFSTMFASQAPSAALQGPSTVGAIPPPASSSTSLTNRLASFLSLDSVLRR